jgi:farnesyl diphosphate synthase
MSAGAAFDLKTWSAARLGAVESALGDWIRADAPAELGVAMRYAVLDGGKRLRPLLVFAASEAVGGNAQACLRAACAVELIHAYSLVHDDLPCMDNDVLRRGKPTVHVAYGEARALLAGDALQALAFELLTPDDDTVPPAVQARLCRLLAVAAGHEGMAGGQAIDLASVGLVLDATQLQRMHELKTGALLQGSVMMGAACAAGRQADGLQPHLQPHLQAYGAAIGLAFQVVDDILDVTADSATLGKTAGKDAAFDKPTYVSLLGLDGARAKASALLGDALDALDALDVVLPDVRSKSACGSTAAPGGAPTLALRALADMVVNRNN